MEKNENVYQRTVSASSCSSGLPRSHITILFFCWLIILSHLYSFTCEVTSDTSKNTPNLQKKTTTKLRCFSLVTTSGSKTVENWVTAKLGHCDVRIRVGRCQKYIRISVYYYNNATERLSPKFGLRPKISHTVKSLFVWTQRLKLLTERSPKIQR